VINVARGSVLDTDALIEALAAGEIAGAGLDVFEAEPDVPPALLQFPNVLVTPHLAGRSAAAQDTQRDILLASLAAWSTGGVPATRVPWQ
jgi:phosphoglycerate dehydrogenase-like enzyme